MRTKKFLSIIAAFAMLAQTAIISAPLALAEGETKIGLILNNDGTSGWTAATNNSVAGDWTMSANQADGDGTTYTRLTSGDTKNAYMYTTLDTPIKFEDGKTIVIDARIRAKGILNAETSGMRPQMKLNLPADLSTSFKVKKQTDNTEVTYNASYTHLALFESTYFGFRFSGGDQSDGIQNAWNGGTYHPDTSNATSTTYDNSGSYNNTWYRYVVKIGYGFENTYELYNSSGTLLYTAKATPTFVVNDETLNSVSLQMFSNPVTGNTIDVDYVKVYNLPDVYADNYADELWQTQHNAVDITDVKADDTSVTGPIAVTTDKIELVSASTLDITSITYSTGIGTSGTLVKDTDYTIDTNTITFTNDLLKAATYTINVASTYGGNPVTIKTEQSGLVFYNDGTSGWAVGSDNTWTPSVTYNADGYAAFTTKAGYKPSSATNSAEPPYIYTSLGDNKVEFESDKTIVLETRVRLHNILTAQERIKIGYNMPEALTGSFKGIDKRITGETTADSLDTKAVTSYNPNVDMKMLEFYFNGSNTSNVRYMGYHSGKVSTSNAQVANTYWLDGTGFSDYKTIDDTWYKLVVKIKPGFIFDYQVYADGAATPLYSWTNQDVNLVTDSKYLENITVSVSHGNTNGAGIMDVDYVKVYNMPNAVADNYAEMQYQNSDLAVTSVMAGSTDVLTSADTVSLDQKTFVVNDNKDSFTVQSIVYTVEGGDSGVLESSNYTVSGDTITINANYLANATYTVTLDYGLVQYPFSFTTADANIVINGVTAGGIELATDRVTLLPVTTTTFAVDANATFTIDSITKKTSGGVDTAVTEGFSVSGKNVVFDSLEAGTIYTVNLDFVYATYHFKFETEAATANATGIIVNIDGTDASAMTTSSSATLTPGTDEDGTTYLRLSHIAESAYATVSLPSQIQLRDDQEVVIDLRFRADSVHLNSDTNKTGRFQLKYNWLSTGNNVLFNQAAYDITKNEKAWSTNTVTAAGNSNHLTILDMLEEPNSTSGIRFPKFSPESQTVFENAYMLSTENSPKWHRVVMKITRDFYTEYYLYDENDNLLYTYADYQTWVSSKGNYIDSFQVYIFNRYGYAAPGLTADIDYLKVYNVAKDSGDATVTLDTTAGTATCAITNLDVSIAKGATLYVASYDSTGKLLNVDLQKIETASTVATVATGAATYKAFIWSGNMKPVPCTIVE